MNEMRKLMETVADLDFNSPIEPLPEKGEWETIYRDGYGGESLLHEGSYNECVRAAKIAIQKNLGNIEGDVLIKKSDLKDGGVRYEMEFVDEGERVIFDVVKVRDFSNYNPD